VELDSIFFISCFLPVSAVLYWAVRKTVLRNWLLILISLAFYAFGDLDAIIVLLGAAAGNYLIALALRKKPSVLLCALGITVNLALLGVYKYLGLFGFAGLAAPLGISFFTFKCISYLIDTYRKPELAQKNFAKVLLYLSFFPHVVSGPISRFDDFDDCWNAPERHAAAPGLRRFIVGLAKKVLLAATLGKVADAAFATDAPSAAFAWLGAAAYMLQIYFDFSGYSDMAIGLGGVFGFSGPENFNAPYCAVSISDFWRRWHMSLSFWFRDYLYIPLGGNRCGKLRAAVNKIIVFTLCGLWHGASWSFVVWGLWHGLLAAFETFVPLRPKKAGSTLACRIYTLLAVLLGFVMFRAGSIAVGLSMLGAMFTGAGALPQGILTGKFLFVAAVSIAMCLPLGKFFKKYKAVDLAGYPLSLLLFALCLMALASGGFTPFIYGQF